MMKLLFQRLTLLIIGMLLCMPVVFGQNQVSVKGTVLDASGQPVIGAAIMQKGTKSGVTTDLDGNFSIVVPAKAVLEVSSIGYATQEVVAAANLSVILEEDSLELDETIVVGYGTQKKSSLTSSISNIRSEELNSTKQTDVVAALQGKVPGLQIHQRTGDAGDFNSDLKLRGYGEPIVVVDGVVRTAARRSQTQNLSYSESSSQVLAQINPEDIESISVLKDASAALYGIGANNGVILITTKQGAIGAPSVKYSNSFSFGVPTSLPEEVDILTYLYERNEMAANVGQVAYYSQDIIDHYLNGDAGWTDNKWYSQFYRDYSFQQKHNVSISGGNNQTQYYLSGAVNTDDGILNADQLGYERITFQGNVTTNINKNLKVVYQSSLNWNNKVGISQNANQNFYTRGLYADRTSPWTVIGNDSHWAYNSGTAGRNSVGALNGAGGYDKTKQMSYTNNLNATYTAPFLKGLSFQGQLSYDYSLRQTRQLTISFPLYDAWTDELISLNKDTNKIDERWQQSNNLYGKFQANYKTKIKHHNISAMFATEARMGWSSSISAAREYGEFYTHDIINQGDSSTSTNSGTRSSSASAGYLGRISYDYSGKYLVEVMARYDGSYIYAPGYRWGFFPSYSLGWRVSDEPLFKKILPAVNNLKVRWSDGVTGGSQGTAYAYQLGYTQTGSNYVFSDGSQVMGYSSTAVAETLVSWTQSRMQDIGVDWEVKKGIIGGSIDWFWRNTTGKQARSTNTVPDMYGLSLPYQNLNASQNVGIDLELSHRMKFKDWSYRITGTATFTRKRDTHIEAEKTAIYTSSLDYYESHTEGRWSNALGGAYYEWNGMGQFTNWAEINNYPVLYDKSSSHSNMASMLPGMYKIEDRNGDGVISSADQYYSWDEGNPPLQFGAMIFLEWKNFELSATFNGAALSHKYMALSEGMGYGWNKTLFTYQMDHYELADGYTDPRDPNSVWKAGYWPALAPASSESDVSSNATYRYKQPYTWVDNSFFRMKSLELGYRLPKAVVQKVHLKSARIHVSGTNLITFCNPVVKQWDPEASQSSYRGASGAPLLKTYVIGMDISF